MITVTQSALNQINAYFKEKEVQPLRVFASPGWGGMRLALALDEPNKKDDIFPINGFDFIIEKDLTQQIGNVQIDFASYGFIISSDNGLPKFDKGCSSGCSCS